jgi:hypothetical protein
MDDIDTERLKKIHTSIEEILCDELSDIDYLELEFC